MSAGFLSMSKRVKIKVENVMAIVVISHVQNGHDGWLGLIGRGLDTVPI